MQITKCTNVHNEFKMRIRQSQLFVTINKIKILFCKIVIAVRFNISVRRTEKIIQGRSLHIIDLKQLVQKHHNLKMCRCF